MASVVNTNVMSINAQQNLMKTQNSMATTIERLSSGLRINSAKDDAAGLAVSEGMTAQVRGLEVGKRNANDAISLAQTAEGALSSMTDNVQRLRELAVQSASDTLTDDDRALLQKEADQLVANMDDIAANTSFNGQNLLDASGGTGGVFKIQVGANAADTIDLDLSGMDMTALPAVGGFDISSQAAAVTSIGAADTDLDTLNGHRADLGAMQNRFDSVIANASNYSENLQAARSRIQDTDFAAETANLTKNQILSQAGTAMLAQANSAPQSVLSLL